MTQNETENGAQAPQGERIAKVMARAGVASRRACETLIEEGRVTVDGETRTTPAVKVTGAEDIRVDGETAHVRSLLFNPMTMEREGTPHTLFIGAWYIDELVKVSGEWRIRQRSQQLAYFHNQ